MGRFQETLAQVTQNYLHLSALEGSEVSTGEYRTIGFIMIDYDVKFKLLETHKFTPFWNSSCPQRGLSQAAYKELSLPRTQSARASKRSQCWMNIKSHIATEVLWWDINDWLSEINMARRIVKKKVWLLLHLAICWIKYDHLNLIELLCLSPLLSSKCLEFFFFIFQLYSKAFPCWKDPKSGSLAKMMPLMACWGRVRSKIGFVGDEKASLSHK